MHRLDLISYSHPKEFWGNGVRTYANSKGKIPSTGSSEENRTHNAASPITASPTHYWLSYSASPPYITNHHDHFSLLHAILQQNDFTSPKLFYDPVILNTHHGHSSWHQTIAFKHVLASYQVWNKLVPWIVLVHNEVSMTFNKPRGCDNLLNVIQTDCKISEKMDTNIFLFLIQLWPRMKVKFIQTNGTA